VQENANEIPAGSMPRCMDEVVRNGMADRTKPGDRCVFTGTRIAVPHLAHPRSGHDRPEPTRETGGRSSCATEGLTRLHALGVGESSCCLNFLACALAMAELGWELHLTTIWPSLTTI
jgi:DNA replication licensing factor MCM6